MPYETTAAIATILKNLAFDWRTAAKVRLAEVLRADPRAVEKLVTAYLEGEQ